uniref:Uncharacterized protein n=1 Tax=Rhizophora mucronata TaxID=61149 RepID=A0A2P2Q1S8_RHIMU
MTSQGFLKLHKTNLATLIAYITLK